MDTPAWYTYSRTALIEPDWRRLPGWRDVTPTQWRDAQWQRAHCVKNPAQLRDGRRRPAGGAVLRRAGRRRRALRHHVHAAAAADAEHDRALLLRRFHTPRPSWPTRSAATCCRCASDRDPDWPSHPRAERDSLHEARDVGDRGPDPPLPDQGAGRAGHHLPPVLRALHPDGPRRHLDPAGRQGPVHAAPGQPAGADARLPQAHPVRTRRGGLGRRRGQRAVAAAGGVPAGAAGARLRPRHPAGHQGAGRPAPALAAAVHAGRARRGGVAGGAPRCQPRRAHPRQPRGRRSRRWWPRRPGRCWPPGYATCATRAC